MTTVTKHMIIAPDLQEVRSAGLRVRDAAATLLCAVEASQMELCVVEVLNNIVKHGSRDESGNPVSIEIEIAIEDSEMVVSVRDNGPGIPRENLKAQLEFDPADIDSLPEGGMGLFVVASFADRLNYETHAGQNVLVIAKRASS